MKLNSCQNCWFNGLQYGALGLAFGYCAMHKEILNFPDGTTCGLHLRKDLTLSRVLEVSEIHKNKYPELICRINDGKHYDSDISNDQKDIERLKKDPVADTVTDYGELGSTIESLAQLKAMPGARAELAMLSLGRGYTNNCVLNDGKWTSGVHLYWWSRRKLLDIPDVQVTDLRSVGATQLSRQIDLTSWSLVMLRLTFIEDIITYARHQGDPLGEIPSLTEQAALSLNTFNLNNLAKWIKSEAIPKLDAQLSKNRYVELANQLHSARTCAGKFEVGPGHPFVISG